MKNILIIPLSMCLVIQLVLVCAAAPSHPINASLAQEVRVDLKRVSPDGWFTLLIPSSMGEVERFADVDGGFYRSANLEIKYSYWSFENTPNFLRDINGRYSSRQLLACSRRAQHIRTISTWIDGRRAIIQRCSERDERRGYPYIYYVTFPRMSVHNGQEMRSGVFNLTITYRDRRYLPVAARVARSLDFD